MQPIVATILCSISLFFILVVYSAFRLPTGTENHGGHLASHPFAKTAIGGIIQKSRKILSPIGSITTDQKQQQRIAIILPYTAPGDNHKATLAALLPYFPLFCAGAGGAADVADFLIFHTGILDDWTLLQQECPSNVKFINLGSYESLAEYLIRVVDEKYGEDDNEDSENGNDNINVVDDDTPKMERKDLLRLIATYVRINPYGLVEFKPALGHIFQDYLQPYSHWGYSDLDIIFGDLGRWITNDEWTEYDIVTYTFGDQHRLYLRGQFTFHRNDPLSINQLWRKCNYLTGMDERFQKLFNHDTKYHVESAEGCYSAAILEKNDIRVKFAVKAWTDIYKTDTAYSHGVFLSRSFKTGRQVLYKADQDRIEQSGKAVSRLAPGWFEDEDTVYKNKKNEIQRTVGERERVYYQPDPEAHCMYWALPKYQTKLCLSENEISQDETVLWIDGQLYKQRYENAILNKPVVTAPFFHFQEWKRSFRYSQLSSFYWSSPIQTFMLVPEGAVPMIEGKRPPEPTVASPLGMSRMNFWSTSESDRSQLPRNTYCLESDIDDRKNMQCKRAVSWRDGNHTKILSDAAGWKNIAIESDVTLVLTLQIESSQASNQRAFKNVIDHLKVSLNRWHGRPCVVVIAINGAAGELEETLRNNVNTAAQLSLQSSLIGAIFNKADKKVSRKALMNMAIDAVPTRWFISGLELERGLSISVDTAFFAHRAAEAHSRLRGNIFLLPQFGLMDVEENSERKVQDIDSGTDIIISLNDLMEAHRKQKVKSLNVFEEECESENDDSIEVDRLLNLDKIWWLETQEILDGKNNNKQKQSDNSHRITALEQLEREIIELATNNNHGDTRKMIGFDESPILLTDNLGLYEGIRTNEIIREIECFVGLRCYNAMKIVQFVILGYSLNVLGGAFAASSDMSRKAAASGLLEVAVENRCSGCSMTNNKDEYRKALIKTQKVEVKRAGMTAIMWAESLGLKLIS